MEITKAQLQSALERSWIQETSSVPDEWSEENPSRGQCVPTALVAQDYLGGGLQKLNTVFNGHEEGHYRNVLADGTIFDACRSQYPDDQELTITDVALKGFASIREKRLNEPDVRRRYEQLRLLVKQKFADG